MFRKLWLSIVATTVGAALLVGASLAADSPTGATSGEAKRGGTIRVNVSNTDFAFVDPALAYDTLSWGLLYTTNLTLLNYPDRPAPEGSRLVPDAAVAFPRVSADGRTYTFTLRKGLRFSDGSAVTARNFAHAIYRAAHPRQASPAIAFLHDVVGADELNEGKASRVTGVSADGLKLTIKLERPNPTFLVQIAMPFFAAVKTNMGLDPRGASVYPSAGPYRIASRDIGRQVVLERNSSTAARGLRTPTGSSTRSIPTRIRACSRFAPARSTTTPPDCRRPLTTTWRRASASARAALAGTSSTPASAFSISR